MGALNKYRAKKVQIDNLTFDSLLEGRRYQELKLMERAGEITHLSVHQRIRIEVAGKHICDYIPDFTYYRAGKGIPMILEDVKGMRSGPAWAMFRLKTKLVEALYAGDVEVEVWPPEPVKRPRKRRQNASHTAQEPLG